MKVVIAGGRDFKDYNLLKKKVDYYLQNVDEEIVVISGTAKGADRLGERYAKEKGYEIERYPADWDRFGKSAGYIRNGIMGKAGDALIAFWDGKSNGTSIMIQVAKKHGLKVRIVNY